MVYGLESAETNIDPKPIKRKERRAQNSEQEDMIRKEGRRRGGEDALLEKENEQRRLRCEKIVFVQVNEAASDVYDISRRKQRKRDRQLRSR